jgi:hypothetical protein
LVIKEVFCLYCGAISEEYMPGEMIYIEKPCKKCRRTRRHKSRCSGGLGKRYHFNDWGGVEFHRDVRVTGLGAGALAEEDGSAPTADSGVGDPKEPAKLVPLTDRAGNRIDQRVRFKQEHVDEKVKRRRHEKEIKRGQRPIYVDLKR